MRTKRRTIAIAILAVVIVAFTCAILSRDDEPRYRGKSLSEWLEIYRMAPGLSDSRTEPASTKAERIAAARARDARVAATRAAAELAVRSIGTNALPLLLQWIRYELPPWRQKLLEFATQDLDVQKGTKVITGKSWIEGKTLRKAERVGLGFAILNANAVSAIPELEAMMKDNQKPDRGLRAIYALGEIGGPAIPVLTNALANTNQNHRCEIMGAIYTVELMSPFYYGGVYRGACLPALTRALDDPDAKVRRQARVTIYNLSREDVTRFNLALRNRAPQTLTDVPNTDPKVLTNTPPQ